LGVISARLNALELADGSGLKTSDGSVFIINRANDERDVKKEPISEVQCGGTHGGTQKCRIHTNSERSV